MTLQVIKTNVPVGGEITLSCDDSSVNVTAQMDGTWKASLPNKTQTYIFTARYEGSKNYCASLASCTVAVTKKEEQQGGGAPGAGVPGGGAALPGGMMPAMPETDVITVKGDESGSAAGLTITKTTITETKTETINNEQAQTMTQTTAVISAKIADKLANQAILNKSDLIEIIVKCGSANTGAADDRKSTEVEIPKAALASIAGDTKAGLLVRTDNLQLTFDNKALQTIASEAAGSSVKFILTENTGLTDAQKSAADVIGKSGKLFELTMQSGDKILHDFDGGQADVLLPVPEKLKEKELAVVYVDDKGVCEILNHSTERIGTEHFVKFTAPHFSTFAIVEKEQAQRKIEKQKLDHLKNLVKNAKFKLTTSKTRKKSVKMRITAKNDKNRIADIQAMGYTVKYKFYRSTRKNSGYQPLKTKTVSSFVNTGGTKGIRYYYKARILVYDGEKQVVQSALKQCSCGVRT